LLCVETDEFAHRDYDEKDEEIRYDDLYMVHSGKWVFIRFNPDGKGVHINDKIEQLLDEIETQIQRIKRDENKELLEIIKMFY
jgi:very-short-patch-repair endonuclease